METRQGNLIEESDRGSQYPWEDIFEKTDTIFTLTQEEFTSPAAVRSAGMTYANRHNLQGVLHVLENKDDPTALDVQFEPTMAGSTN